MKAAITLAMMLSLASVGSASVDSKREHGTPSATVVAAHARVDGAKQALAKARADLKVARAKQRDERKAKAAALRKQIATLKEGAK